MAVDETIADAVLALICELDLDCMRYTHADALTGVIAEMNAQDEEWGVNLGHSDQMWLTILTEELGETARDMLEGRCPRAELVQVAAVAVQWIACIDVRDKDGE